MKTFERYVLRRLLVAFLMTLAALTGVVWATQALRQLDLVTSKGQTILQFIEITMMAMPFLVVIVAPFALLIALTIILNALSNDSELIVVSASGASRAILLKPVMVFASLVAVLSGVLSLEVSPAGLASLRDEITRVRVDLVANIVKPGRFIEVEDGLTFHIRNRSGDGQLDGLLLNDERGPDTNFTYEAARGRIIEAANRTLLVMQDGTIQRRNKSDGAMSIVRFQSYAFDLSNMIPEAETPTYKASERATWNLLTDTDDYAIEKRDNFRGEFHDRLSQPLYPLAFALIVFAFLGQARTTRQSQNLSVLFSLVACVALRTAGFGAMTLISAFPDAVYGLYLVPVIGAGLAIWAIMTSTTPLWVRVLQHHAEHTFERIEAYYQSRRSSVKS